MIESINILTSDTGTSSTVKEHPSRETYFHTPPSRAAQCLHMSASRRQRVTASELRRMVGRRLWRNTAVPESFCKRHWYVSVNRHMQITFVSGTAEWNKVERSRVRTGSCHPYSPVFTATYGHQKRIATGPQTQFPRLTGEMQCRIRAMIERILHALQHTHSYNRIIHLPEPPPPPV